MTPIVGGEFDQTAPSLWGTYLAYLDDRSGWPQVYVKDVTNPGDPGAPIVTVAGGEPFAHGAPDVYRTFVAYRIPDVVRVYDAFSGRDKYLFDAPGVGAVAMAASLVAWEQADADGGDVAWRRFGTAQPVVLRRDGTQRSVAASGDWLAFIDDRLGEVHVVYTPAWLDVAPGTVPTAPEADRVVFRGDPREVAIWSSATGGSPLVAITSPGTAGTAITVRYGDLDASAPAIDVLDWAGGEKVDPHLADGWVGFETVARDVPGGAITFSQVTAWRWTSTDLFMPNELGTNQVLHDLVATEQELVVVWADDQLGSWDVYRVATGLPFQPPPDDPGPVRCDDPTVVPIAQFEVVRTSKVHPSERDEDHADRGEKPRGIGRPSVGGAAFHLDAATQALVCIDARQVASAWVAVDGKVVAFPGDFEGGTVALEGRVQLAAGDGRAGAVVAGIPGASLRVRLLADPGGNGNGSTDGSTCSARGDCPAPRGHGCGSAGSAGSLALVLVVGVLALGTGRRRARR